MKQGSNLVGIGGFRDGNEFVAAHSCDDPMCLESLCNDVGSAFDQNIPFGVPIGIVCGLEIIQVKTKDGIILFFSFP